MTKFSKVKRYYDAGLWTEKMVRDAAARGWITEMQAEEIIKGGA